MRKQLLALSVMFGLLSLVLAPIASAQRTPPAETYLSARPNPFEISLGYNYINVPDAEPLDDLHGFNVSAFYNWSSWLAFGGEFMAGFGTTHFGGADGELDLLLGAVGPRLSAYPAQQLRVFTQALVGGVHGDAEISRGSFRTSSSDDGFAVVAGVGADWRLTRQFSWRVLQADYIGTNFSSFGSGEWDHSWRVSTGIVFSFGGR